MSEKNIKGNESVKLRGHVYDGIEELDHSIPKWFQALFLGTVLWGIMYFFHYTFGFGPNQADEYAAELKKVEQAQFEALAKSGGPKRKTEQELQALVVEPGRKESGATLFVAKCASCHGNVGQGGIGPNLADSFWIHGGKLTEIEKVIQEGVLDKGMPPWGSLLKPEESVALVAYIHSIQGSNPPGAKAPQGVKVSP